MGEEKLKPRSQAIRPVYKNVASGGTTPFSNIFLIEPRVNSKTGKHFILWNDIKTALPNSLNVWQGQTAVPFLLDENFEYAQPLRFSTYPGIVLDVAIASQEPLTVVETLNPPANAPFSSSTNPDNSKKQSSSSTNTTFALGAESTSTRNQNPQRNSVGPLDDGDADENYVKGVAYFEGKIIRQDHPRALDLFLKAANQGHAPSQSRIFKMWPGRWDAKGDYSEMAERYLVAAKKGDPNAQFNVGFMYDEGLGFAHNHVKAMEWYQKAADQGYSLAQYSLGLRYQGGSGITQNFSKARELYQMAADQGNAMAQCKLGDLSFYCCDVTIPGDREAFEWFQKSADQGCISAQWNLGKMYYEGRNGIRDYSKAIAWFRKAADHGFDRAQCDLGNMYYNGEGVIKDNHKAIEYWQKAVDQGDVKAKQSLSKLI